MIAGLYASVAASEAQKTEMGETLPIALILAMAIDEQDAGSWRG